MISRVVRQKRKLGFVDGPLLANHKGEVVSAKFIDELLIICLSEIYEMDKSLFPLDVQRKIGINLSEIALNLRVHYSCSRTFRRSSDTRALEVRHKLFDEDIEIINRWRSVERAKGKRPNNKMKQHYAEVEILLRPFLRYTSAM